MKPTTGNTHALFEHLRSAAALLHLLVNDLERGEARHTFDMGLGAAADVLDAIGREVRSVSREADRFEAVNSDAGGWAEYLPERMLFHPMAPVPTMPEGTIELTADRVRGVLAMTAAVLRQGEVYVYPNDVAGALDAVGGMLATMRAVLDKVEIDATPFEGSIHRPGMGPSKSWPGESAA